MEKFDEINVLHNVFVAFEGTNLERHLEERAEQRNCIVG